MLFAVGVVAQFFLVGLGAFRTQRQSGRGTVTSGRFGHDFSAHVTLGHVLLILGALVVLAARSSLRQADAASSPRSRCRRWSNCGACLQTPVRSASGPYTRSPRLDKRAHSSAWARDEGADAECVDLGGEGNIVLGMERLGRRGSGQRVRRSGGRACV